ncbi:MAG: hypothetical protein ACOYK6_02495 [Chthoniobacterales bacterium]
MRLISTLQPFNPSTLLTVRWQLSIMFLFLIAATLTSCESLENGSHDNSSVSASAIPWNKPASWEGAGALGGMGFQGTH